MTKTWLSLFRVRPNSIICGLMFLSHSVTCHAQFRETPQAPYSEARARAQIRTLLQQTSPSNSQQTIASLANLVTWYREVLDEELIAAWQSDGRANLPDVILSLADPRIASAIIEFSWREQRSATFNLTYAPMLGKLMARYVASASPFLTDLLGTDAADKRQLNLSRSETEAVCRILLDMPNSGAWRANALQILPHYRDAAESLLDRDIHEGDMEKSTAAKFWLADLRAGNTEIRRPGPNPVPRMETAPEPAPDGLSSENVSRPTIRISSPDTAIPLPVDRTSNPAVPDPTADAKVGSVVPVIVSKIDPDYTRIARKLHAEGVVTLSVLVGRYGLVQDIRTVQSLGYGLDAKAVEAVQQWKFEPGRKGGLPVDMRAVIKMNFRLFRPEEGDHGWFSGPIAFVSRAGVSPPEVIDGAMPLPGTEMSGQTVAFDFTVDAGGLVRNIQAVSGSASAVELLSGSLSTWKFQPAAEAGRPVEATGRVEFTSGFGGGELAPALSPHLSQNEGPTSGMDSNPYPHPVVAPSPAGTGGAELRQPPPLPTGNTGATRLRITAGPSGQYKVIYRGGTLRDFKLGAAIKLSVGHDNIVLEGRPGERVLIPNDTVTAIISSQDARVVSVSVVVGVSRVIRRFYINLKWDRESVAFEVDEKEWRGIVADLEGSTGVRASGR